MFNQFDSPNVGSDTNFTKMELLTEIQKGHDTLVQEISRESAKSKKDNGAKIRQFAGISLSDSGISQEDWQSQKSKHASTLKRRIAEFNGNKEEVCKVLGSKAIVLEKNFAENLFHKKLGEFFFFSHMDGEGKTHGMAPYEATEEIRKYENKWQLRLAFGSLFVCLLSLAIAAFLKSEYGDGSIFLGVVQSFFAGICFLSVIFAFYGSFFVAENMARGLAKKWSGSCSKDEAIRVFFPRGRDYPEGCRSVPVWIKFPPLTDVKIKKNIQKVLKISSKLPEARPIVIAHRKAIGLEVKEQTFKAIERVLTDPMVAIETKHSIILFPDARWGDIPEEKRMIEKIQRIFRTEGKALFG